MWIINGFFQMGIPLKSKQLSTNVSLEMAQTVCPTTTILLLQLILVSVLAKYPENLEVKCRS